MSYEQRQQHRQLYLQLRLQLSFPGDTFAGEYHKPYNAVNKDDWTWEQAMSAPDTPRVAYLRARYPLAGLMRGAA